MKFILAIVVVILSLIFVIQNPETVQINFLAWYIEVSKSILVLVSLGFGIILGWILRNMGLRKKRQR